MSPLGNSASSLRGRHGVPAAAGVDLGGPGREQRKWLTVGLHPLHGRVEQPAGMAPAAVRGINANVGDAAEAYARLAVAHGAVGDPEMPDDGAVVLNDQALGYVPGGVAALVPFEVVAGRVVEGAIGEVEGFAAPVKGQVGDGGVHRQRGGALRVRKSGPTRGRPGR